MRSKRLLLCIVCVPFFLFTLGCQPKNQQVDSKPPTPVDPIASESIGWKPPTKKELTEKLNGFQKRLNQLDADKIKKMTFEYVYGTRGQFVKNDITDRDIIKRWVAVLKKMKVTAKESDPITGKGFSLYFEQEGEVISFGGIVLPTMEVMWNDGAMLYCENYDELQEEIEVLKRDSGYIEE